MAWSNVFVHHLSFWRLFPLWRRSKFFFSFTFPLSFISLFRSLYVDGIDLDFFFFSFLVSLLALLVYLSMNEICKRFHSMFLCVIPLLSHHFYFMLYWRTENFSFVLPIVFVIYPSCSTLLKFIYFSCFFCSCFNIIWRDMYTEVILRSIPSFITEKFS